MTNPKPEEFKHVIISIDNGEDNSVLIEAVRGKNGVLEWRTRSYKTDKET